MAGHWDETWSPNARPRRAASPGRPTNDAFIPFGTLTPRAPTPTELIASFLSRMVYGNDDRAGYQNMLSVFGQSPSQTSETQARDMLNPLSIIDAAYNSGQDVGEGNYLSGIAGLLATAAPIPGVQKAETGLRSLARKLAREEEELASRNPMLYNPPTKPQRGFGEDYQNGFLADEQGRLLTTMDGEPLTGAPVAGRTHVGQGNSAIPEAPYEPIGTQATGQHPQAVAKSAIGGDAGQYVVDRDRRSGRVISRAILTDKSLPTAQKPRVLAHEVAHAIDEISGTIPVDGLDDELRRIYNDLNSRDWRFEKQERTGVPVARKYQTRPEDFGYAGEKAKRELIAEAVRAYKADPNYIKTVAPKTAARIRAFVNTHPTLSKIIQFNSLGLGSAPITGQWEGRE